VKVEGIRIVAPSVVGTREEFSVGVKLLTEPFFAKGECYGPTPSVNGRFNHSPRGIRYMDNVPGSWEGQIEIEGGEGYQGPSVLPLAPGLGPYPGDLRPIRRVEGVKYSSAGIRYINAVEPKSGSRGISNPIEVTPRTPTERLYWGDIHSQTFFTDGLRSPEELYHFARDEAFLDIFALADHAEFITNRQWEYFVGVTNDFNRPHRFVTLVGLEWTSQKYGHRNVYYPGNWGPILRASDPSSGDLDSLYEGVRPHRGIVVPHHSANSIMGVDWSLGHDPELERLVEIYSVWGNSERPARSGNRRPIRILRGEREGQHVLDALRLGRTFGFVGSGDIHDGRPGDELHSLQEGPEIYPLLYRQGLMGVWARELTREAVFEAMWNRRVFASTNVRLILRFSINGSPMGSHVAPTGGMNVAIGAVSEVEISRIDLVRNGEDLRVFEPRETCVSLKFAEDAEAGWHYVRVTRADGEMAWSSPIWVENGG
jgi:hypothetical protein